MYYVSMHALYVFLFPFYASSSFAAEKFTAILRALKTSSVTELLVTYTAFIQQQTLPHYFQGGCVTAQMHCVYLSFPNAA